MHEMWNKYNNSHSLSRLVVVLFMIYNLHPAQSHLTLFFPPLLQLPISFFSYKFVVLLLLSRRLNWDKNELVILTMAWNFRCESEKLLDYAKHLEFYTFMDSSVEMAHNWNKFHLKFLKIFHELSNDSCSDFRCNFNRFFLPWSRMVFKLNFYYVN